MCVVSDDCSSPEAYAALEQEIAGDPRFVLSRSRKRLGFYRNFERALGLAPRGAQFVTMADQDDVWHAGKLSALLRELGPAQLVYSDARVVSVDGELVFWIEAVRDEADDRLLVLREIRDLEIAVPPPESISYHGLMYVQRMSGRANIDIAGRVPERSSGSADVWRYRAAGDLFLQIEEGGGRVFMLAGESVHRGMIDVLPGR